MDITDRHDLEARLRQAQKMEAIGQLAGGIAHDFNNLLTIIQGYSRLLIERLAQDERGLKQARRIDEAAEKAASLTAQLLAFSRKQVLQPRVISLTGLVENLDKLLRRLIGENITLLTKAEPDLWRVKADPSQIEQVVMNLAINARDAMPHGGKLTIETGNANLDESYALTHPNVSPGPYVMLAVSDDGVGMSPETQARIFEPFFTTKEKGRGTGLGLSTVYGTVKQSGGFIWVYSELGHGTTFKIYLPRTQDGIELTAAEKSAISTLRGAETILVVEDDVQLRELVRVVLDTCGYRVITLEDARKTHSVSDQELSRVSLLLTDVVMPGTNGRELAQLLRSRNPKLRVLYMSGYTENAIVHHGVLDSGTNFLQKPFPPSSLAAKVREVLDQRVE